MPTVKKNYTYFVLLTWVNANKANLESKNKKIIESILRANTKLQANKILNSYLNSENPVIRVAAALKLSEIGSNEMIEKLKME